MSLAVKNDRSASGFRKISMAQTWVTPQRQERVKVLIPYSPLFNIQLVSHFFSVSRVQSFSPLVLSTSRLARCIWTTRSIEANTWDHPFASWSERGTVRSRYGTYIQFRYLRYLRTRPDLNMETGEPKTNYYALRQESPDKNKKKKRKNFNYRSNLTEGKNKKKKI